MSNGAKMNYDFGQKRHWRRTAWNEISRRVEDKKGALVLYLAGEKNYDKAEAINRGFCHNNMIAIERDKRVVDSLREDKQLCIHGDILEVLRTQTYKLKPKVVIADLCCGASEEVLKGVCDSLVHDSSLYGSVTLVNLQRGREKISPYMKDMFATLNTPDINYSIIIGNNDNPHLHRGYMLFNVLMFGMLTTMFNEGIPAHNVWAAIKNVCKKMDPWFYSYKSKTGGATLTFDSVVMNNLGLDLPQEQKINVFGAANKEMERSVSAILAHRTRRMGA